jgi:hypothetical protein
MLKIVFEVDEGGFAVQLSKRQWHCMSNIYELTHLLDRHYPERVVMGGRPYYRKTLGK